MQNHMIFGAGLIGCYLGGCIKQQGVNVDLICRPNIAEKLKNGVKLTDYLENQSHVSGFTFNQSIGDRSATIDVVWLTVKCTDVAQAAESLRDMVNDETLIVCCQNGLGSDEMVKGLLPSNRVIKAMVPFNVVELEPGHLHRGSEGDFTIEREYAMQEQIDELIALLNSDLLPVASCDDMPSLLWAKLQLNLGNSINALANIPVKAMLEQRQYRLVIAAMMKELLLVTSQNNVQLPKVTAIPNHWIPWVLSTPNWLFKILANKMLAIDPNVRTSMWWDLSQGKKTEIDHLNGAVVEHAKRLGIECPVNLTVIQLIKEREKDKTLAEKGSISASILYQSVMEANES